MTIALQKEIVVANFALFATTMVAELGFEPRQTESESVVLPLHNSAILCNEAAKIIISKSVRLSSFFINFW